MPCMTRARNRAAFLATGLILLGAAKSPAPAAPAPCTAQSYRSMDFAIGVWEAKNAKGAVIGVGEWRPILGGCAIRFTYRGHRSIGTAQDAYDATRSLWQKTWVDDGGDVELSEGHASA